MRNFATAALLGAAALSLAACGGGGQEAGNSADELPGTPVNAADGINHSSDASGTTGSTTGDAGGPLNIAADAANDSAEENGAGTE